MTSLPPTWPQPGAETRFTATLDQLQLDLRRESNEYWIETGYLRASLSDEPGTSPATRPEGPLPLVGSASYRFLAGTNATPLALVPCLADRPVVSRPQVPALLLPRERITLLVSTVMWIRIASDDRILLELPTTRLSDTWFGPNTLEGELCYAAQTRARLELLEAESPWRALTPVTIINRGDDNLNLERINLPVLNLALYGDGRQFWTSALTVGREGANAPAKVQIGAGPPQLSPTAQLIAPPRRPVRDGVLDKALSLLFA